MSRIRLLLVLLIIFNVVSPAFSSNVVEANADGTPTVQGTEEIQLSLIGRYNSGAGIDNGGAEIVAYDKKSKQAFVVNGGRSSIDIVDLSNPQNLNLSTNKRIDVTGLDLGNGFAIGDITSVAVAPSGEFVVFSVPAKPKSNNGRVVLAKTNGDVISHVEVGALPDMVTFSPDGKMVLVANEGEPNDDYTIDPEGSVSIINVANGPTVSQSDVTTVSFNQLSPDHIDKDVRIFGPGADAAKDFEPEYITVSKDSKLAYVSLQENNAIAVLDLQAKQFKHVHGLGFKDHSLPENALDVSDKDKQVNIKPWPILGMYQPDGITMYEANGSSYIVTANEGDARDYDGFSEETRVKSLKDKVKLNADKYPNYTQEQLDELVANGLFDDDQLGRLRVTSEMGKNENGLYESLYSYGARSFSVWNANTMELVFDSGSDFERIILEKLGKENFNANHTENTGESRSDDKGPEPEDVKIGQVNGQPYAFIGMERVGGIMVYNLSNPSSPAFTTYFNSRDFSKDPMSGEAGDLGTEGLMFVAKEDSPTGKPLLLATNEVSGTMSVYEISSSTPVEQPGYEPFELTIMHTNDTHAHLNDVARRVTAVNSVRAEVENSLLLDAGDVFSGTLFFNQYNGLADVEFMNMMGYDAMVPGNHEFDKGPAVFAEFIKKANFPIVSANINYDQESVFNDLFFDDLVNPAVDSKVYPAIVKEVDGEQVGIFGLTTEDTAFISGPGKNIVFEDYLAKARETVKMLRAAGINKIIALTHLGHRFDLQLAEQVEGIDIVVGGHSHTELTEPVVLGTDSEPTIVLQAKEYGEYLGRVDVTFGTDGVLQKWNGQLLAVADFEENADAAARLKELEQPIEDLKKEVVGKTDVFLNGEREAIRSKETNLGNLITDGMLSKAKESRPATIAFQNAGGIRASIDEGDITLGEVLTVLPFANNLVTLDLTGAEIIEALEVSVSTAGEGHGRFLQVAGLRFAYDIEKPAFERVTGVEVETESGYTPIVPGNMYTVATNAFMADGGDGYSMLKEAKDEGRMTELYIPDYDVFTEYVSELGIVGSDYAEVEGRIIEGTLPVETEVPVVVPIDGEENPTSGEEKGDNKDQDQDTSADADKSEGSKGGKLPETATNFFNGLMIGFWIMAIGFCLYFYQRRKQQMI